MKALFRCMKKNTTRDVELVEKASTSRRCSEKTSISHNLQLSVILNQLCTSNFLSIIYLF